MKKFFTKEVKIAIAVIVSLACLFWGIEYLKGINLFTPVNFYYVHFNNVEGLTDSAPVSIKGYKVGQVREIIYDYETGSLRVQLSLDKDLKIPTGTKVVIASDMLGTAHVELELANNSSYYKIGDELEGQTEVGMMDNISDDLLPSIVAMMPKIDSILTNLNKVVANPALSKSIDRLDNITANLEVSSRQLSSMMGRSVPGIMGNVNGITENLNTMTSDLKEVSATLKSLPIDSTMNNVNATTKNLMLITQKVNGKDSSLGMLLNDKGLYNHMDKSLISLDSLITDVKKNPKRYINVKVF